MVKVLSEDCDKVKNGSNCYRSLGLTLHVLFLLHIHEHMKFVSLSSHMLPTIKP